MDLKARNKIRFYFVYLTSLFAPSFYFLSHYQRSTVWQHHHPVVEMFWFRFTSYTTTNNAFITCSLLLILCQFEMDV